MFLALIFYFILFFLAEEEEGAGCLGPRHLQTSSPQSHVRSVQGAGLKSPEHIFIFKCETFISDTKNPFFVFAF